MATKKEDPQFTGMIDIKIRIPRALHEAMRTVWLALKRQGDSDLKLHRLYRKSVEQFVYDKPQQQLLKERANDGAAKAARTSGAAARV